MHKKVLCSLVVASIITLFLVSVNAEQTDAPMIPPGGPYTNHVPIVINGDSQLIVGQNGVVSGSGSENDPFIIEGWNISANTATGIKVIFVKSSYFVVRNCFITDGKTGGKYHHGIDLTMTDHGRIERNILLLNYIAISIDSSSGNTIINNQVSSSGQYGISISASGNTITCNEISDNSGYGIYISYNTSINNHIYHNNFYNNKGARQAYDEGQNLWDNGMEGNYWKGWTSPDNNSDGVVDLPYYLEGGAGAMDNYPLANAVVIPDVSTVPLIILSVLLLTALVARRRRL